VSFWPQSVVLGVGFWSSTSCQLTGCSPLAMTPTKGDPKMFEPEMSIADAKEILMEKIWDGGVECPCCERHAEVNEKPVGKTVCLILINLYRMDSGWGDGKFIHLRDMGQAMRHAPSLVRFLGSGSFAALRHWGIVEELSIRKFEEWIEKGVLKDHIYNSTDKRRSGYWRITEKGRDFVENKISLPKSAFIYNARCLKLNDVESIQILGIFGSSEEYHKALGEDFGY